MTQRHKKLPSSWFQHCKTPDDKVKLQEAVGNSKYCLDLLVEILNKELKQLQKTGKEDYHSPSWSHYQADKNGYVRAINNFKTLLGETND